MVNTVLFYSEELNEDIYQNNNLINSKKILTKQIEKDQVNKNSYDTIVDSKDYLGCINGNCSKIQCSNCSSKDCNCSNNNLASNNSATNNSATNNLANKYSINFLANLIDFIFVLVLLCILVYIVYKKESFYLLHILGITLVYIFYKMYLV